MANFHDDALLNALEAATDADSAVAVVERILQGKRVNALREAPRFRTGLDKLATLAAVGEPPGRLRVVAALYRLGASSRPVMKLVEERTAPLLQAPLPPIEMLQSGEDRYYIALAVVAEKREWSLQYAAHAIAIEDTAERARKVFAEGLAGWVDVTSLILLVADELSRVSYPTEKPGESAARRITRVIGAIRPALVTKVMEVGEDPGRALRMLFSAALDIAKPDDGSKVSERAASECCGLVYDVLRTQIEVVTDAAVYRSLEQAARWTSVARWPHFVRRDKNAQSVLTSLERAILLLARRGTTDADLLNLMQFFLGSREKARARAKVLAESRSDLASEVREWLSQFGRVRETPRLTSMDEAREAGSDPAIAAALVAVWEVRRQFAAANDEGMPPSVRRLLSSVEQLSRSRGLVLKLEPGDVVEYSSRSHELLEGGALGIRNVTVVAPLVEKISPGGIPSVVLRAIVKG